METKKRNQFQKRLEEVKLETKKGTEEKKPKTKNHSSDASAKSRPSSCYRNLENLFTNEFRQLLSESCRILELHNFDRFCICEKIANAETGTAASPRQTSVSATDREAIEVANYRAFKKLREKSKADMHEREQKLDDAKEKAEIEKIRGKKNKSKGKEKDGSVGKELKSIKEKPSSLTKVKRVHVQEMKPDSTSSSKKKPISATVPYPEPPTSAAYDSENRAGDTDRTRSEAVQVYPRYRKRQGACTNCCGGLPGRGPGVTTAGCRSQCCCDSGNRLRGGSDRSIETSSTRAYVARSSSTPPGVSQLSGASRSGCETCGYPVSSEFAGGSFQGDCGYHSTPDSFLMRSERNRGGCGSCRGLPQSAMESRQRFTDDRYGRRPESSVNRRSSPTADARPCCRAGTGPLPACQRQRDNWAEIACATTGGCCPCGGCGGAACSDNPGGGKIDGGCCGGSPPRGLPCKCKCQSCSEYHPLGGCGGQSCGRIYSCAGSGGGRCCFPRNHKRRSGPDCCGGADPNCGGCC